MAAKRFRYTRADFEPLVTKPLHFDIFFDVKEDRVVVALTTTLVYVGAEPKSVLKLNSKALEIQSVKQITEFTPLKGSKDFVSHVQSFKGTNKPLKYEVDTKDHFLVITLDTPVTNGQEFVIKTVSTAHPTENILEGLYYDYTPKGCPKTIITQCQQYGFQRIVPCIDTMDAKAYYSTTIVADKRYTNMITNGDLAPGYHNDEGTPIFHDASEVLGHEDASRHVLKYYNHKVNMAPYLFFLGVGTYVTYRRTLEFPDGGTTLLELLSFPESAKPEDVKHAVQMLHDSILWVMMSLGPESTEHCEERQLIYKLLAEREELKAKQGPLCVGTDESVTKTELSVSDEQRLQSIRNELKSLLKVWKKTGYKYTGAVYREIGMENSNYGGMENVGNTTIVSSCLCPTCRMGDLSYEYMERVKVHEYYHNINGSEVTGQSPFEIWLNEAVTVHMERKRYAAIFGDEYARLSDVLKMFTPALGPLACDKSDTCLSIEPEGFNQTQELVSAVTYSKAPEVVRMVELMLGKSQFNKALDLYYTRYMYSNATSSQWVECMEEVSGLDLSNLSRTWLKRPKHPEVSYSTFYEEQSKKYIVKMEQTGFESFKGEQAGPWEIPIDYALIKDGKVLTSGLYMFKNAKDELSIQNVTVKPDFISFARNWSFFGISKNLNATNDQLIKQATNDPDDVNKYFAYRQLADNEKARIIEGLLMGQNDMIVSPAFIQLHGSLLFNENLNPAVRALILSEKKMINSREDLSHHYKEIADATKAILQALYSVHHDQVLSLLKKLIKESVPGPHKDQLLERALKIHLMSVVVAGNKKNYILKTTTKPERKDVNILDMAVNFLDKSTFVTDQTVGLRVILQSEDNNELRKATQARILSKWRDIPDLFEIYISIIASLDAKDVNEQILALIANEAFNLNQTHHTRTLARGMAVIREFTVKTESGRELMANVFHRIGTVNQMSAYPILKAFDQIEKFDEEEKKAMYKTLEKMQNSIDPVKEESLYNQLNIMLKKA